MKAFFLGTLFGAVVVWLTQHAIRITFSDLKCAVYFALLAWLLWNVSALLRARARSEDRKWAGGKVGKWEGNAS